MATLDDLEFLGTPERSLRLDTRAGSPIQNAVAPDPPPPHAILKYERLREAHGRQWHRRKAPCGFYNCFGMVFASRRTAIYDETEIQRILREDGYREVSGLEAVPGDVVFYRASWGLLHAGLVLEVSVPAGLPAVRVLSKWDDASGEDYHGHIDHPYGETLDRIEFWTDRPKEAFP